MENKNEIEFYVIRKRPHERELVAAVCLDNGGYVYYNFLPDEPKPNSIELLDYLTKSTSLVKIERIDNIENYIDLNNNKVIIHPLNLNNFRVKIMCDRLTYSLKKFIDEEKQLSQGAVR